MEDVKGLWRTMDDADADCMLDVRSRSARGGYFEGLGHEDAQFEEKSGTTDWIWRCRDGRSLAPSQESDG